jgi:hypothetical protein
MHLGGNSTYLSQEEASFICVEKLKKLVKNVGISGTLVDDEEIYAAL